MPVIKWIYFNKKKQNKTKTNKPVDFILSSINLQVQEVYRYALLSNSKLIRSNSLQYVPQKKKKRMRIALSWNLLINIGLHNIIDEIRICYNFPGENQVIYSLM